MNLGLNQCSKEPVELVGSHVISQDQLFVGTLNKTKGGTEIKNIYVNRENSGMFDGMGAALAKIKEFSPGGMLIFHPTYTLMNIGKCLINYKL